ncbi:MAG: hypothetical protein MRK02_17340 [Candidatus Scalindua sp.]|nr:hypothetical protein [Candidatus Scalindua sp.]
MGVRNNPAIDVSGKQRDGNYALCVGIPTGCFSAAQLRKLSDIIEKFAAVGHFSTAQSLIIAGIPERQYYNVKQAVLGSGL